MYYKSQYANMLGTRYHFPLPSQCQGCLTHETYMLFLEVFNSKRALFSPPVSSYLFYRVQFLRNSMEHDSLHLPEYRKASQGHNILHSWAEFPSKRNKRVSFKTPSTNQEFHVGMPSVDRNRFDRFRAFQIPA